MKVILAIPLLLLIIIGCSKHQKSIHDYTSHKVKFAKTEFTSNNGEFSINLPKGWHVNEDPIDSETLLYTLETGSPDSSLVAMGIHKLNVIYGNINHEFDSIMNNRLSNTKLIETSTTHINNMNAKMALLTYEQNGEVVQEELDIFIPINDHHYYFIGLISDKNEHTENNLGMMFECVNSFALKL